MNSIPFAVAMGRTIRTLRKQHGLSQGRLGAEVNVSAQQVQKWESGTNSIASCYLPRIAGLLGVSVASLFSAVESGGDSIQLSEADSDGFLAARYVSRIGDAHQRKALVDYARKLGFRGRAVQ